MAILTFTFFEFFSFDNLHFHNPGVTFFADPDSTFFSLKMWPSSDLPCLFQKKWMFRISCDQIRIHATKLCISPIRLPKKLLKTIPKMRKRKYSQKEKLSNNRRNLATREYYFSLAEHRYLRRKSARHS